MMHAHVETTLPKSGTIEVHFRRLFAGVQGYYCPRVVSVLERQPATF